MAKQSVDTIKQWFETGDYPTQQQFWDWLDSFIHKDDELAIANIEGLYDILVSKADASQLNALNNKVVLVEGVTSWAVPAYTLIEKFWVIEPTTITLNVGRTPGGSDIIEGEVFTSELIYAKDVSYKNAGNIYFSGTTINTIIIILKR